MATLRPDPTFYPSPRMAMKAPPETLAYVVAFDPKGQGSRSDDGGRRRSQIEGLWQDRRRDRHAPRRRRAASFRLERLQFLPLSECAPSSFGAPLSGGPGTALLAHVYPRHQARSEKTEDHQGNFEAEELAEKTGYSRPHTIHCGPDGIYVSALGNPDGDAPGGIFLMDHETFDVRGQWEMDRGPQEMAYDFWWHLGQDTVMTSEWGTPNMIENGIVPETCCSATNTATRFIFGTCTNESTSRRSTSGPSTRWRWSCVRPTIRPSPTASWAWWSAPPTSRVRSGPGTGTATNGRRRRSSKSRRSRPRRMICPIC